MTTNGQISWKIDPCTLEGRNWLGECRVTIPAAPGSCCACLRCSTLAAQPWQLGSHTCLNSKCVNSTWILGEEGTGFLGRREQRDKKGGVKTEAQLHSCHRLPMSPWENQLTSHHLHDHYDLPIQDQLLQKNLSLDSLGKGSV